MPVPVINQSFDAARAAWKEAGRESEPRLVAACFVAFGDEEKGRNNIYDICSGTLDEDFAKSSSEGLSFGAAAVRKTVRESDAIGTDKLIPAPALDTLF